MPPGRMALAGLCVAFAFDVVGATSREELDDSRMGERIEILESLLGVLLSLEESGRESGLVNDVDPMTDVRRLGVVITSERDGENYVAWFCVNDQIEAKLSEGLLAARRTEIRFGDEPAVTLDVYGRSDGGLLRDRETSVNLAAALMVGTATEADSLLVRVDRGLVHRFDVSRHRGELRTVCRACLGEDACREK